MKGGPAGIPWVSDSMTFPSRAFRSFREAQVLEGGISATCLLWTSLLCFFWVSEQPAWVPKSWPGAGLNPPLSQGSPEALILTAVVPTGTATHIPPASTLLMSLRWQVV